MTAATEQGTIHEQLERAGVPLDSHESDLYAKVTPESTAIVEAYEHKENVTTFTSQIDGDQWYDIPFAFTPYWKRKGYPSKVQRREMALREMYEHTYDHKKADPDNCQACAHAAEGEDGPNVAGWLRVWVPAGRTIPAKWFAAEMTFAANENKGYFAAVLRDIQEFGLTVR